MSANVRADSLTVGTIVENVVNLPGVAGRVTKSWVPYKRGNGYGSVGVEGRQIKMFCADSIATAEKMSA